MKRPYRRSGSQINRMVVGDGRDSKIVETIASKSEKSEKKDIASATRTYSSSRG